MKLHAMASEGDVVTAKADLGVDGRDSHPLRQPSPQKPDAKHRWRRVRDTVSFAHGMSGSFRPSEAEAAMLEQGLDMLPVMTTEPERELVSEAQTVDGTSATKGAPAPNNGGPEPGLLEPRSVLTSIEESPMPADGKEGEDGKGGRGKSSSTGFEGDKGTNGTDEDVGHKEAKEEKGGPRVQEKGVRKMMGKKGMEGLRVKQDRSILAFTSDLYVSCLKMPPLYFLLGVFTAPIALAVIFVPFYAMDLDGLMFDDDVVVPPNDASSPYFFDRMRRPCFVFTHVFLYSLSLCTTFGGSPLAARSAYALVVANINTLLAQLLFVFLSSAVFARMAQPSQPVRCSRLAIIKDDDHPDIGMADDTSNTEQFKVFATRLVLTGPMPCELVDVKINLTFRIFVSLASGSLFCSTHNLELVRSEVAYLRYGLMVRHIIDRSSPVFGHTRESLLAADASFSLTVVGLERTSMQSIFHMQDYYVYDGDVVWDGDFVDFITLNNHGRRILDHSKIDLIRTLKSRVIATRALWRMGSGTNAWKSKNTPHPPPQTDHSEETAPSHSSTAGEDGHRKTLGPQFSSGNMMETVKDWTSRAVSNPLTRYYWRKRADSFTRPSEGMGTLHLGTTKHKMT